MKKFYVAALVFILLSFSNKSWAQPYTDTFRSVSAGGLASVGGTWVGGNGPGNDCHNCIIYINGDVIGDEPTITITNSRVIISPGGTLEIDQYYKLVNTEIFVNPGGTLLVNDEVDMYGTSIVTLGGSSSVANANNDFGNPVHGTGTPTINYFNGLFYITDTASDGTINTFYAALSPVGQGDETNLKFAQYSLCPAPSGLCGTGVVDGPSQTQFPGPHSIFEFVTIAPLPVILAQFVASQNSDHSVKLLWTTTSEINSGYFNIERSPDGNSWQTIGTVNAKGFSSIAVDYTYTDAYPLSGINYYRLKMVDADGKFKYSKVVTVSSDAKTEALVVYSNPFTDEIRVKVNIHGADNLLLTVTDMVGKTYFRQLFDAHSGDNFININPAGASSGIYMLHIQGRTYDKTVKLLKQ